MASTVALERLCCGALRGTVRGRRAIERAASGMRVANASVRSHYGVRNRGRGRDRDRERVFAMNKLLTAVKGTVAFARLAGDLNRLDDVFKMAQSLDVKRYAAEGVEALSRTPDGARTLR